MGTALVDRDAPEAEEHPRSRRRWRRWALVVVAVLLVLGGLLAGWLMLLNRDTRPKTTEEAVEEFREGNNADGGAVALRPAAGVYTYEGSGREQIDIPPASHSQGPEIPATVTHGDDGCWTFKIDYSVDHWQDFQYCARDGSLAEVGGRTFQRWNFVATKIDNLTTFVCDPVAVMLEPGMEPGDTHEQSCEGTSEQVTGTVVSAGPDEYVGEETVVVGGEPVRAHHVRRERTFGGAQSGEELNDFWFAVDDGLPLRNERSITVRSDSPIGTVTFTEEGEFTLTSLAPQQ